MLWHIACRWLKVTQPFAGKVCAGFVKGHVSSQTRRDVRMTAHELQQVISWIVTDLFLVRSELRFRLLYLQPAVYGGEHHRTNLFAVNFGSVGFEETAPPRDKVAARCELPDDIRPVGNMLSSLWQHVDESQPRMGGLANTDNTNRPFEVNMFLSEFCSYRKFRVMTELMPPDVTMDWVLNLCTNVACCVGVADG